LGGQEIIDEVGIHAIRARNSELTEHLITRLEDAGFRIRGAATPERRSALVMVHHDAPAAAVKALADENIIVDSRPGYVRVSPHFYNTIEEVEQFVDVLKRA
ncbi:MAG TPA: hypothetical protein VK928_03720, partial [Longimicrobiales bacterium]|nr:hypothetical protein [Longimicrobiales bacterium]